MRLSEYGQKNRNSRKDDGVKELFYSNYGDLPYLLDINVDEHLFRALAQFWNSTYSCFKFGEVDMVPTVEEYTNLLRCPRIQVDKVYFRAANVLTFTKKLTRITGMSEQWFTAQIKQKGENRCIPWRSLRVRFWHTLIRRRRSMFFL
ncbi:hypothetical protein Godav_029070 [Gossypium davidsonii]|uniref:DUF7745 domain-containing protein n=1 Tax=Gossypium davidsonii TaxID=34287 RepID=A0A7J8TE78_GOSDV|nr:hypothetical protein [Gossypium davidsonii]